MLHDKSVAIISPQPLINLGLKQLLQEYFSARCVTIYPSAKLFLEDNPDKYDFYFLFSETFLVNCDFFLPRKAKSILLIHENQPSTSIQNIEYRICILDNISSMVEQMQQLFESACQRFNHESQEELSPREIEVLQLVAQGLINKEIADKLNISFNTVLTHRKNITAKLGIKTVSGLSFYAMMNGYLSSNYVD